MFVSERLIQQISVLEEIKTFGTRYTNIAIISVSYDRVPDVMAKEEVTSHIREQ